jgi:hypothetical protein
MLCTPFKHLACLCVLFCVLLHFGATSLRAQGVPLLRWQTLSVLPAEESISDGEVGFDETKTDLMIPLPLEPYVGLIMLHYETRRVHYSAEYQNVAYPNRLYKNGRSVGIVRRWASSGLLVRGTEFFESDGRDISDDDFFRTGTVLFYHTGPTEEWQLGVTSARIYNERISVPLAGYSTHLTDRWKAQVFFPSFVRAEYQVSADFLLQGESRVDSWNYRLQNKAPFNGNMLRIVQVRSEGGFVWQVFKEWWLGGTMGWVSHRLWEFRENTGETFAQPDKMQDDFDLRDRVVYRASLQWIPRRE